MQEEQAAVAKKWCKTCLRRINFIYFLLLYHKYVCGRNAVDDVLALYILITTYI